MRLISTVLDIDLIRLIDRLKVVIDNDVNILDVKKTGYVVTILLYILNDINQSLLKVNMKLDQVCTTTSEIRTDIKTIQNRQLEHTEQITVLQERINTAFLRIDELRKDVQDLQKGV